MSNEAKVKPSPTEKEDDSFLGALCELGNALGDMIISPLPSEVQEVQEVKEVKEGKEKVADGTAKHNISINLGGFFASDSPDNKRPAPPTSKKGKTARVEEPPEAGNSDESE